MYIGEGKVSGEVAQVKVWAGMEEGGKMGRKED